MGVNKVLEKFSKGRKIGRLKIGFTFQFSWTNFTFKYPEDIEYVRSSIDRRRRRPSS